jgi:signal transduction histidine kinase/CheY-like chemotaxis protein
MLGSLVGLSGSPALDPVSGTIPVMVFGVCAGVLLAGSMSSLYAYTKTRVPIHLTAAIIGSITLLFVCGELGVAISSLSQDAPLGRQFHRLQALAILLFLPAIPFALDKIVAMPASWRKLNRAALAAGMVFLTVTVVIAFAAPSYFVSTEEPLLAQLDIRWTDARGKTGLLYLVRDAWATLLILGSLAAITWDLLAHGRRRFLWTWLAGLGTLIFASLYDYSYVHLGFEIPFLPHGNISFGIVAITLFIAMSTIGIFQQHIAHLQEQERGRHLKALGVLAGGIAHDFNNLLTSLLGNLSLLKRSAGVGGEAQGLMVEAENAAFRAKNLSKQLLAFAKGNAPVLQVTSLGDVIKDTANFILTGSKAQARFRIAEDLQNVQADEGQISQVIQNLVLNAAQSMPKGGEIMVSASNDSARIWKDFPKRRGSPFVRIRVQDKGKGIPKALIARIFEPYFTTKDSGSGLGLALSYSIVNRHQGHIFVKSQEGEGTAFDVYLPATQDPVPVKTEAEESEEIPAEQRRILLLEDDDLMGRVVVAMLGRLGFHVERAITGGEAIEKYEKALGVGQAFDCVLMDITLPGELSGEQTLQKILDVDPKVRTVASSGRAEVHDSAWLKRHGFSGALPKPYTLQELEAVIDRVCL